MRLLVDGLCLETLRFPAHLGDGPAELEGRDWLNITALRRGDDGAPRLCEELLVAFDWARDPDGKGRNDNAQKLTLIIPTRHLALEDYAAFTRELELFAALVLRRYGDVVAAFEIGNENWGAIGASEYAAKARLAVSALETAMARMGLEEGARPEIMVQFALPTPPHGPRDGDAADRAADRAIRAAIAARMQQRLQGTRFVGTRFSAEARSAVEVSVHEADDRVVAYVRSRLGEAIALDIDFASLLPEGRSARASALRIGAASGAAPRGLRAGNTLRRAAEADPWALTELVMDGTLLDTELAPYEAVEVTFLLGGDDLRPRSPMRLVRGGQTGTPAPRKPRTAVPAGRGDDRLMGAAQSDEMIGWLRDDVFIFGKTCGETGPVIRDFTPGRDVIDLVLPGLSLRDITVTDSADGVMVQAGKAARFLLNGAISAGQIDPQRDFRLL